MSVAVLLSDESDCFKHPIEYSRTFMQLKLSVSCFLLFKSWKPKKKPEERNWLRLGSERAGLWIIALCGCTYCHRTLHYLKMTAKLACQQSYTHLSNFTGALVLLPNIDQGYGAYLPFWKPQGEIREFLSAVLFKHARLAIGWFPPCLSES